MTTLQARSPRGRAGRPARISWTPWSPISLRSAGLPRGPAPAGPELSAKLEGPSAPFGRATLGLDARSTLEPDLGGTRGASYCIVAGEVHQLTRGIGLSARAAVMLFF